MEANCSRNRMDTEQGGGGGTRGRVRRDIRHWQRQCDTEDPNEGAGVAVGDEVMARLEKQLAEIPARLDRLHKAGLKKFREPIRTAAFCANGARHAGIHGHVGGERGSHDFGAARDAGDQ